MFRVARLLVSLAILLAVGLVAACSDSTGPTPVAVESANLLFGGGYPYCTPRPAAQAAAWIGPSGGSIKAGKHELRFPQGSLSAPTLITMYVPSDTVNQVVFGPEGLEFPLGLHPTLKMDYKNCDIPKAALKRIVYTDDSLQVQESLLSVDNLITGEVAAKLKHFSRYAVMY